MRTTLSSSSGSHAHAVGEHQVSLQQLELVVGDVRVGELAEAGVDAVHGLAARDDAPHGFGAGIEACSRRGIERRGVFGTCEGLDRLEREVSGDEAHYLSRCSIMRATCAVSTSLAFLARVNVTNTSVLPLWNPSVWLLGLQ